MNITNQEIVLLQKGRNTGLMDECRFDVLVIPLEYSKNIPFIKIARCRETHKIKPEEKINKLDNLTKFFIF